MLYLHHNQPPYILIHFFRYVSNYQISYVLATHNQLPELRAFLDRLCTARKFNEEIVVIDGGSTDGTAEYLFQLQAEGQIQRLLSESHKSEAHGLNKALVLATGQFIKMVTLSDAFCLSAIREAAKFIQEHPEVDVLIGNTGILQFPITSHIVLDEEAEISFRRWFERQDVVCLPALSMILRREALALTGFLHTGVAQVEKEFTYRLTSLNVSIAWSTSLMAVYVQREVLAQVSLGRVTVVESERMEFFHDKRQGSQTLRRLWRKSALAGLFSRHAVSGRHLPTLLNSVAAGSIQAAAIMASEEAMIHYNSEHQTEFIFRAQEITKSFQKTN